MNRYIFGLVLVQTLPYLNIRCEKWGDGIEVAVVVVGYGLMVICCYLGTWLIMLGRHWSSWSVFVCGFCCGVVALLSSSCGA
jgi:hypothetical protein